MQVIDLGELPGGLPYIVMELIDGESLAARLGREGPLNAVDAVSLLLPLLDGLVVAHDAGIVHRDLKPENVLLASSSKGVRAKLVDFGIARLVRSTEQLTVEGAFIGTPAFMAPEQIRGLGGDERVDVWGAAALLYAMMTTTPPFAGTDLLALLRQVVEEPPPFPRVARGLDGKLWAILMNAMRKAPSDRTPSVAALRDELSGWYERHAPASSRERGQDSETLLAVQHSAKTSMAEVQRTTENASRAQNDPPATEESGRNQVEGDMDRLIRQKLGNK